MLSRTRLISSRETSKSLIQPAKFKEKENMGARNLHVFDIRAAAEGIIGNGSFTTDWTGFQFQANSTNAVINQLRFATSKTVRQSSIILASFNAVVGLVLALGIFGDCYWSAKRADPKMKLRTSMYKIIGPMNIFPFTLAIGIFIQGIITAVEQSKGLQGLLILGCLPISQVMLPSKCLSLSVRHESSSF